jgi:hypothetical protein
VQLHHRHQLLQQIQLQGKLGLTQIMVPFTFITMATGLKLVRQNLVAQLGRQVPQDLKVRKVLLVRRETKDLLVSMV